MKEGQSWKGNNLVVKHVFFFLLKGNDTTHTLTIWTCLLDS